MLFELGNERVKIDKGSFENYKYGGRPMPKEVA